MGPKGDPVCPRALSTQVGSHLGRSRTDSRCEKPEDMSRFQNSLLYGLDPFNSYNKYADSDFATIHFLSGVLCKVCIVCKTLGMYIYIYIERERERQIHISICTYIYIYIYICV